MSKAELKTKPTEMTPADFIAAVPDPRRREEATALDALYRKVTGQAPKMWGPSIVGYGQYTYTYGSGRSGTMARAAFSPRKGALTLYLDPAAEDSPEGAEVFARLGPHSRGKSCLYIKKLESVDQAALEQLVRQSWISSQERWPD